MNRKLLILILVLLVLCSNVYSATVKGIVYDINLEPAKKAVLKVNTIPEQTIVSKDGSYLFNLEKGNYVINSVYQEDFKKFIAEQNVTILDEGEYTIDLILFPDISEEENLFNEDIDIPNINAEPKNNNYLIYIIIGIIIILCFVIFFIKKNKFVQTKEQIEIKEEVIDDLSNEVINFIKEKGRRITQKDIRKRFPVSEAKISLVISELEEKGIIQKFKKGRGNIIILK